MKNSDGDVLANRDSVGLIKDLTVTGVGRTIKHGTVIKTNRLTGDPEEIDGRTAAIKGLVLRNELVKTR